MYALRYLLRFALLAGGVLLAAGAASAVVPDFQITSLGSTAIAVNPSHDAITGDDRGGIAVSATHLFYSGDSATGAFEKNTLGGTPTPYLYEGLVNDLATGKVYTLGYAGTPWNGYSGWTNQLFELDPATGASSGPTVTFPDLYLYGGGGIYSGYGQVILHTGYDLYGIEFLTGAQTYLGSASPLRNGCENWGNWGVAEQIAGQAWVAAVYGNEVIRTNAATGATQTIASFSSLSDMCSFTMSLADNRWYFHHEGASQFAPAGTEVVGWAPATWLGAPIVGPLPGITPGVFSDNFNDGTVDPVNWPQTSGAAENADCGAASAPFALHFSGDGSRYATTRSINVPSGAALQFNIVIGAGQAVRCENLDGSEEVYVEYSTDGFNWWNLQTFGSGSANTFTPVSIPLPAGAISPNTQFRWIQYFHSGDCCDHWAIDDVVVGTGASVDAVSVAAPTNAWTENDQDGDGVPDRARVQWTRVTVDPNTGSVSTASDPDTHAVVDPNPNDNSNPVPVLTQGPFSTVTPGCGGEADRVCYKVGASFRWMGLDIPGVVEGSQDANALPFTLPVDTPTGALPTSGPDNDGDGIPATYSVPMERVTIRADGGLQRSPAPSQQVAADANDADPTNPKPAVTRGPFASVTPGCAGQVDRLCYQIGADVRWMSADVHGVQEGSQDANALPFTLPADTPTGALPVVGPDADGDGVPSRLLVAMERVTIQPDGSIGRAPAPTVVVPVDPDDGDPLNPVPGGSADLEVAPGCAEDEVCASASAQARAAGQGVDESRDQRADAGPATDAAASAAGWRVVRVDGSGAHVALPAAGVSKETPALSPATPLERVILGPGSVTFTRSDGLVVTVPVVSFVGIVTTQAGGQTVSEPTLLVTLQDLVLGLLPPEVLVPLPGVDESLP